MSPWKTLFRYIVQQFFGWYAGVFLSMLMITLAGLAFAAAKLA